jgi:hypothetical protein
MIYFGIGVAVGAAAAWAILHFAVVRKLRAQIELGERYIGNEAHYWKLFGR